jgi:ADP-heptose:LPS heptosyltransferase
LQSLPPGGGKLRSRSRNIKTEAIAMMNIPAVPRILLIRRDNIGDLVLITPLVHALRQRHPRAWIGVLGNTYNTPVLAGHPDIDEVFGYDKSKHRQDRSKFLVYADTARLLLRLRALHIDIAVLAGPGAQVHAARIAGWIKPRAVLGFLERGAPRGLTMAVEYGDGGMLHEAEDVFRLGAHLGVNGVPGPCVLAADAAAKARCEEALFRAGRPGRKVVAVHISARRPLQRWQTERFAGFMQDLHARIDVLFLLLWAPGTELDPRHPGDDSRANAILDMLEPSVRCTPWHTRSLADLTGALAVSDLMVCADGGAMHVASGLGLPIVALFGDSPVRRWRPWGVESHVLHSDTNDVRDIHQEEVVSASVEILRPPEADIAGSN